MSIRIAHFCDSHPGRPDGVANAVGRTVELLRAAGHHVDHYHPGSLLTGGPGRMRSIGVPVRQFRLGSPWFTPFRTPVDVVHVHTTLTVGMAGMRFAARRGLPVVFTWHIDLMSYINYFPDIALGAAFSAYWLGLGWTPGEYLELLDRRGRQRDRLIVLGRQMLDRIGVMLAPSDKTAAAFAQFGSATPVWTVPTPVAVPTRSADPPGELRRRLGLPPGVPVVLSVGRVTREKNPSLLLRAFALVQARRPDARLVILGVRQNARAVRGLVGDLGLNDAVHLLPPVPRAEVDDYYRMADVLAFASGTDTQGLVLAEAEAAGLPVVVADPGLSRRPGTPAPDRPAEASAPAASAPAASAPAASAPAASAPAASAPAALDRPSGVLGPATPARTAPWDRLATAPVPAALASALLRVLDEPGLRDRLARAGLDATSAYPPGRYVDRLVAAYELALRSRVPDGGARQPWSSPCAGR